MLGLLAVSVLSLTHPIAPGLTRPVLQHELKLFVDFVVLFFGAGRDDGRGACRGGRRGAARSVPLAVRIAAIRTARLAALLLLFVQRL